MGDAMSTAPVARACDDAEALRFFGEQVTILAAGEETARRLAVVHHEAPEATSPPWHVQPDDDETFYVLDGRMTFWSGDPERPVAEGGPGTFVFVPRGVPHSFRVDSPTARFLTVHTPSGHEAFYRAAGGPVEEPAGSEPDIARVEAAGREHGVRLLGPPPSA